VTARDARFDQVPRDGWMPWDAEAAYPAAETGALPRQCSASEEGECRPDPVAHWLWLDAILVCRTGLLLGKKEGLCRRWKPDMMGYDDTDMPP
jgi:hypothetical protein